MAELTEDPTPTEGEPGLLTPHPSGGAPFDGEGKTLTITKPVHPAQLLNEVYDRLGDRAHYNAALQVKEPFLPVSEANPAVLHIHPASVDMRTVRGVVESHAPDPRWGMDEQAAELADLKTRLATEDLGPEELNRLLRSILA